MTDAAHGQISNPSVEGFDSVKRYWDKRNNIIAAKLLPGEYYVTLENELITTVLGSCISACICDPIAGVGGMNHFMLPETSKHRLRSGAESVVGNATRYGNYAMEHLINVILASGGKRKNLQVKLFGGGKIIPTMSDVGKRNIQFVLEYIDA
ncbi:MAG: chemoreceptor glutamine deamidase CheD, partial [Methyloprofundus sp.]|nr:chemoreceptor glutamine deamidase CheD [Methyloprofundus sp.]